jgi:cytochrome c-type biogenesis protein CcmH/NrfG
MGLFSALFTWPLAPVQGLIKLGELIEEQVERQLHDPASVRRRLEEVEEARAAGLITEQEEARATEEILQRMIT